MNGDFPEAPAVAFTNIKTKNGFYWSFTMRSPKVSEIIEQIEKMEKVFAEKEWTALELRSSGFNKKKEVEIVPGVVCPKCKSQLKVIHAKNGKTYHSCTNNKYNPQTGKYEGCDYFVDANPKPQPVKVEDDGFADAIANADQ